MATGIISYVTSYPLTSLGREALNFTSIVLHESILISFINNSSYNNIIELTYCYFCSSNCFLYKCCFLAFLGKEALISIQVLFSMNMF